MSTIPAGDGVIATTPRLRLRRIRHDDALAYFTIFGDPRIAEFDDFEPITLAEAEQDVHGIVCGYASGEGGHEYAAEFIEHGLMVGVLCWIVEGDSAFIGFHFDHAYQGQGLASEAVRAFLPWLRESQGLRVAAVVDPANAPSIRLLERVGLQRVGERPTADGTGIELVYRLDP